MGCTSFLCFSFYLLPVCSGRLLFVHQFQQQGGGLPDLFAAIGLPRHILRAAVADLHHTPDAVDGGADIVAHALQKYAYKNATALSTISDDMKSTIVTRYSIPADKVQVIYNWGHEELKAHSDEENVFLKK